MTTWETDDEYGVDGHALPSPANTPYMTPRPSRPSSRRSSKRSISPRQLSSSAPPPLPQETPTSKRISRDMSNDETLSPLDPRRFTPTLHANLVAEILSLRREQDDKLRIIENLETTLHSAKTDQEDLKVQLATNSKESRSLKRQLALLEGGTVSAMGELSKERDEAADNITDLKRRLELAQKKSRSYEENVDRLEQMLVKEKDDWEAEKRRYETKVHAAETRLRAMISEMEIEQLNAQRPQPASEEKATAAKEADNVDSDSENIRSESRASDARFSLLNGPSGYADARYVGSSLADELNFYDSDDQTTEGGRDSVVSTTHGRNLSQDSIVFLNKHRRGQSTDSMIVAAAQWRQETNREALEKLEGAIVEVEEQPNTPKAIYIDTGVQYSPPPSPKIQATSLPEIKQESKVDIGTTMHKDIEVEANQSRKRVHVSPPLALEISEAKGSHPSMMVQTHFDPLSPPRTPKTPKTPIQEHVQPSATSDPIPISAVGPPSESVSVATQTELLNEVAPTRSAPPPPITIPLISIHPPTSGPATPREHILPQHLKDVGCQANMPINITTQDASVQTDAVLVNERLKILPDHLQPSAISSAPPSPHQTPEPGFFYDNEEIEVPSTLPPRNPKRLSRVLDSTSSPEQTKRYHVPSFSLSDDDFLEDTNKPPRTMSSLLARYDGATSDDGDEFPDLEDDDIPATALSVPRYQTMMSKTTQKPSGDPYNTAMGLQDRNAGLKVAHPKRSDKSARMLGLAPELPRSPVRNDFPERTSSVRARTQPLKVNTSVPKQPEIRRTALISSGVSAHQNKGSSQASESQKPIVQPPFPIPKRASSKQPLHFSVSAPNSSGRKSPTVRGNESFGDYGRRSSVKSIKRQRSIRKSRSAANLPGIQGGTRRRNSRSPPSSPSTEASYRSHLPPLPLNDITSPTFMQDVTRHNRYGSHRPRQHSATTEATSVTGSGSAGSTAAVQSTGVVDSIAQTMIGEWMWKYVRRRKSFGVMSEANQVDETSGNGPRHRRWVWLAPYERAIMWSSKQPTSGSALMGKAGRKLTIESVLDVPDTNAVPKNSGTPALFNRSILILTPSRALKFTAPTKERHYVWMTALTFLAHSNQAIPTLKPQPPPPSMDIEPIMAPKNAHLRKSGIRDSIRIAKGRTVLSPPGSKGVSSSGGTSHYDDMHEHEPHYNSHIEEEEEESDAAEPPLVPRFVERGQHGRKRSNTGPKLGPRPPMRGYSGPAATSMDFPPTIAQYSSSSYHSAMSPATSVPSYNRSVSGMSSVRSSETSARPSNNFFEAVGTIRMEAFISPMTAFGRADESIDEFGEVSIKKSITREREREREARWRERGRGAKSVEDDVDHFRNF